MATPPPAPWGNMGKAPPPLARIRGTGRERFAALRGDALTKLERYSRRRPRRRYTPGSLRGAEPTGPEGRPLTPMPAAFLGRVGALPLRGARLCLAPSEGVYRTPTRKILSKVGLSCTFPFAASVPPVVDVPV